MIPSQNESQEHLTTYINWKRKQWLTWDTCLEIEVISGIKEMKIKNKLLIISSFTILEKVNEPMRMSIKMYHLLLYLRQALHYWPWLWISCKILCIRTSPSSDTRVHLLLAFQIFNYLFNPAFDDLKFRVYDLFDLTNRQFVLVRTVIWWTCKIFKLSISAHK